MPVYEYHHDLAAQTVYKFPSQPSVTETKDGRGRRTGWYGSMEILITRAENKLHGNQWEHATSDYPTQHFKPDYTRESAMAYFLGNHAPGGESISEGEYVSLRDKYDAMARAR
jgi:hypothetical protein